MGGFPDIDAASLSASGLLYIFVSYGYMLFVASSLISEGSDLLLLVPALAGIVGSCVLPVLGAVPDGAIMLFSGMGPDAQDQLAVGVGALAGSTIMLLTIPWGLALLAGRVDIEHGKPRYMRPKLTSAKAYSLSRCGVGPGPQVRSGAVAMLLTSLSYLVIQGPASYMTGATADQVAHGEHWFAFVGIGMTLGGFVSYLTYQVVASSKTTKILKTDEIIKRKLARGELSLAGAMSEVVAREATRDDIVSYQSVDVKSSSRLAAIVKPFFARLDRDGNGKIDRREAETLMDQFGEPRSRVSELFDDFDTDNSGDLSFEEVVAGVALQLRNHQRPSLVVEEDADPDAASEEDDVPDDIAHLDPQEQQRRIKRRAILKLVVGTVLVLVFSDPMVDVMAEIGQRTHIDKFYVSFILAPLASNASELIAAYNFALKKTSKTITISFASLEGAACMNNTFCLAIFFFLIYFRGLAWQYSAETIAILVVQILVAFIAFNKTQTLGHALLVFAIYPTSILLVYVLENLVGLD